VPYFLKDYMVDAMDKYLTTRKGIWNLPKNRMIHMTNRKGSERTLEIRDLVISNYNHTGRRLQQIKYHKK
jgi:hypothetical protein